MTDGPICRLLMSSARLVGVELALVCSTRARAPVEGIPVHIQKENGGETGGSFEVKTAKAGGLEAF